MQFLYYYRPIIPWMWAKQMQRRLLKMHSRKQLRSVKGMRLTFNKPIGEEINFPTSWIQNKHKIYFNSDYVTERLGNAINSWSSV